ncbi:MAG: DUF2764 domain-containing protein [Spirochaetes bacterium]|nr:DUF2764 domain-containing protein [Spirochaetota bacterium]
MRQYYYLISSLVEIAIDMPKKTVNMADVMQFFAEELAQKDFDDLKKIYLFSDIKNLIYFQKEDDPYLFPAYYLKEEYLELKKDTDSFLPFIAEHFYLKNQEKRAYPDLTEIDEIVMLFYQYLEEFSNTFVKDYFLFELDLQNITTALSLRMNELPYGNKLIPFGEKKKKIAKSTSHDFNLGGDFPGIEKLVEAYESHDLIRIEKTIEDIRWNWLDESTLDTHFALPNVIAYAVKLASVERWSAMTEEKGQAVLDELIEKIKSSIDFGEEFNTIGGKRK